MRGRAISTPAAPVPRKWDVFEADSSMYMPANSTSKLVVFVRHAEGLHNAAHEENEKLFWSEMWNSPKLWDAPLTDLGKEQSRLLGEELMNEGVNVDLVVVSPLTRTLQTAALSFGAVDPMVPMLACETCRERIAVYASEGRSKTSDLVVHWPKVNFSEVVSEEDPMFEHKETDEAVGERALLFLDWLMKRPEERIAVVSHSVFLQQLYMQFQDTLPKEFFEARQDFAKMKVVVVCPANGGKGEAQ